MTEQKLYHFQQHVREAILNGRNIILQAPTGGGKTRAAIEPGLIGFNRDRRRKTYDYPPRIIYLQPMRTLANSAVGKLQEASGEGAWAKEWYPTIQTGDQPDDPLFEGKLIVATVDQMLASFLTLPYSIPRRLDNINAGAMLGSYLIFDEFHLYPRNEMMLTVLAMLKMLQGISRFTIMSATFSATFLQAIAKVVDAEFIGDPSCTVAADSIFTDVTNIQTQQRTWYAESGRLDADAVNRLRGRRTICVCNVVDRAQKLYDDVRCQIPDADCILLHSRFYQSDRKGIQEALLDAFKDDKNAPNRDIIVIATQVVEVGLDISADVLLTECAPAASLIQRAGRCARRENQEGRVHVFQPVGEDGSVSYSPYGNAKDEDGLEAVCRLTWEAISSSACNGQVIRFAEEQRLVDLAHGEMDRQFVDGLVSKVDSRMREITDCLAVRNDSCLSQLIRNIASVPLFIHPNPKGNTTASESGTGDEGLTIQPFRYESLSVSRGQISHLIKITLELDPDAEIPMFGCDGVGIRDQGGDDAMTKTTYQWTRLREGNEVFGGAYAWFAVEPFAVSYRSDTGFGFGAADQPAPPSPLSEQKSRESSAFIADTYVEHISGLNYAYSRPLTIKGRDHLPLHDEFAYPLSVLCSVFNEDVALGERMLRLALALHDVGKLNRRWQTWASAWQHYYAQHLGTPTRPADGTPLAHTDTAYDRRDPALKKLASDFKHPPRGTHAVESAEAVFTVLFNASGRHPIWTAITTAAIMRHHTPDAETCEAYRMVENAQSALVESLRVCGFDAEADTWVGQIVQTFDGSGSNLLKSVKMIANSASNRDMKPLFFYLLIVRILRLADQRSGDALRHSHPLF